MASTSFRSERDYIFKPYSVSLRITFENFYKLIVKYNFVRTILNSSIVTICSTTIGLVFSILAAFAFVTMKFPSKRTLLNFFVALIAVPPIVVLIPVYVFMVKAGLINTYLSAIIVYAGFIIPFSIFLLTGFFQSIPASLIDAARLDGCGDFGILWKIFVPLSKAPIMTLVIVNGLWVWNELLIALVFLQREEMRTLMAAIAFSQSRFSRNVPFMMAQSLIATIPPLIVYGISRRYLVKGFMGGMTK
jgi:ABC-type glycerol-3-phosphate transport system permease component